MTVGECCVSISNLVAQATVITLKNDDIINFTGCSTTIDNTDRCINQTTSIYKKINNKQQVSI